MSYFSQELNECQGLTSKLYNADLIFIVILLRNLWMLYVMQSKSIKCTVIWINFVKPKFIHAS